MSRSAFSAKLAILLFVPLVAASLTWGGCGDEEEGVNVATTMTRLPQFPSLEVLLEVPSSAPLGEHVPLKLTVENVTEAPVRFEIGGLEETNFGGSYDFLVTADGGSEAWHWLATAKGWPAPLSSVTLQPGEELRFEQQWPQADNRGKAVQPGTYLVRGVLHFQTQEGEWVDAETEAVELVVSP